MAAERSAADRWSDRWARRLDRAFVDAYVANSEFAARNLRAIVGDEPPVWVVPNGVNGGAPLRRHERETRAPQLLCVGNITPNKGQGVLLEAIRLLRDRHPGIRATLVGRDFTDGRFFRAAEARGLGDTYTAVGFVDDVRTYLARADVAVLPTLHREGMPTALLEAMRAGVPVVASRVGGVSEIVEHGRTGLLVTPGDAQGPRLGDRGPARGRGVRRVAWPTRPGPTCSSATTSRRWSRGTARPSGAALSPRPPRAPRHGRARDDGAAGSLRYLLLAQLCAMRDRGYGVTGVSTPGPDVPAIEARGIPHRPVPMTRRFTPLADVRSLVGLYRLMRSRALHDRPRAHPQAGAPRAAGGPPGRGARGGEHDPRLLLPRPHGARREALLRRDGEARRALLGPHPVAERGGRRDGRSRGHRASRADPPPRQRHRPPALRPGPARPRGPAAHPGRARASRRTRRSSASSDGSSPRRACRELLEAARVVRRAPSAGARFLARRRDGRGEGGPDLAPTDAARALDDAGVCVFAGFRHDMPELYQSMDVFVLPSHREGFPRAPMEASAMKVPCVVTDVRGCRQAVTHGRNGLVVPAGDGPALAEAILAVLGDPALARRLGEEGRRRALARVRRAPRVRRPSSPSTSGCWRRRGCAAASRPRADRAGLDLARAVTGERACPPADPPFPSAPRPRGAAARARRPSPPTGSRRSGPHVDAFEREFAAAVGARHAAALSSGTAALHLALQQPGRRARRRGPVLDAHLRRRAPTRSSTRARRRCSSTRERGELEHGPRAARRGARPGRPARAGSRARSCWSTSTGRAPTSTRSSRPATATACPWSRTRRRLSAPPTGARAPARAGGSAPSPSTATRSSPRPAAACSSRPTGTLIERARFLATQARDPAPHYQHSTAGFNYRMSNVLAAIGRGQLRVLPARVPARRGNFASTRRRSASQPGLSFMPEARLRAVVALADRGPDRPRGVRGHRGGRPARPRAREHRGAPGVEADAPAAALRPRPARSAAAVAEQLFRHGLCLPSGSALTDAERERVVETVLATPRRVGRGESRGPRAPVARAGARPSPASWRWIP